MILAAQIFAGVISVFVPVAMALTLAWKVRKWFADAAPQGDRSAERQDRADGLGPQGESAGPRKRMRQNNRPTPSQGE